MRIYFSQLRMKSYFKSFVTQKISLIEDKFISLIIFTFYFKEIYINFQFSMASNQDSNSLPTKSQTTPDMLGDSNHLYRTPIQQNLLRASPNLSLESSQSSESTFSKPVSESQSFFQTPPTQNSSQKGIGFGKYEAAYFMFRHEPLMKINWETRQVIKEDEKEDDCLELEKKYKSFHPNFDFEQRENYGNYRPISSLRVPSLIPRQTHKNFFGEYNINKEKEYFENLFTFPPKDNSSEVKNFSTVNLPNQSPNKKFNSSEQVLQQEITKMIDEGLCFNHKNIFRKTNQNLKIYSKQVQVKILPKLKDKTNKILQTEKETKNKIETQKQTSFISSYDPESLLQKATENFQALLKDLFLNQNHINKKKKGKNCGVQCSEKQFTKKTLKRGRPSSRKKEQGKGSEIFEESESSSQRKITEQSQYEPQQEAYEPVIEIKRSSMRKSRRK